ncbi:MAG: chemotaxis protein [Campylobacterota bacterium]|nr:chemotaxis protein [Campylobacterota bacterium]
MTQDELDALMNGDIDEDIEIPVESNDSSDSQIENDNTTPENYTDETSHRWPLPATDENKMVHQLDDVTKESEEKASEIFDIIENISNDLMDAEEYVQKITETIESNIELFETLSKKFPDVEAFQAQLDSNKLALENSSSAVENIQNSGDSIMSAMDIMQYQDIHRQKIERVINVMRSLSNYMNTLFESKQADDTRVSSAQHIHGDTTQDLASTDDIEALLAQFGN